MKLEDQAKINVKQKSIESSKKLNDIVQSYGETRGRGKQYHGTPNEIKKPTSEYYNDQNIYGQGFYTTDALDIASGYSKRKSKSGTQNIYEVKEKTPVKFYDMDKPISKELKKEIETLKYSIAPDYLKENQTLTELFDDMRTADISTHTVQRDFDIIQYMLRNKSFGGMNHKGGKLTKNKPHDVKIYFEPESQITIEPIKKKVKKEYPLKQTKSNL